MIGLPLAKRIGNVVIRPSVAKIGEQGVKELGLALDHMNNALGKEVKVVISGKTNSVGQYTYLDYQPLHSNFLKSLLAGIKGKRVESVKDCNFSFQSFIVNVQAAAAKHIKASSFNSVPTKEAINAFRNIK